MSNTKRITFYQTATVSKMTVTAYEDERKRRVRKERRRPCHEKKGNTLIREEWREEKSRS